MRSGPYRHEEPAFIFALPILAAAEVKMRIADAGIDHCHKTGFQ
jgi:hypothetical protein